MSCRPFLDPALRGAHLLRKMGGKGSNGLRPVVSPGFLAPPNAFS